MNLTDARFIADLLSDKVNGSCELFQGVPMCVIAGGVRRLSAEVHDIEIVSKPILKAPRAEFGQKKAFATEFDKVLAKLEDDGYIHFLMGGEKLKKYELHLQAFGLEPTLNPFKVEFYQCTPPAQFGVLLTIRTGPARDDNNFSKWMVTQRKAGGALPNGYRVKHAAVWREDQIDSKDEPISGEVPLSMPSEKEFFEFCGLQWRESTNRVALWRKVTNG